MTYKENDARQGIGMQEDEKSCGRRFTYLARRWSMEMSRLERCL